MLCRVWDLETTDLKADIGSLIVATFGDMAQDGSISRLHTEDIRSISGSGSKDTREKKLALWARDKVEEADILIGHNSLAFDRHFLNGVLFRHGERMCQKRIHWDTMQVAKGKLSMGVSMANLADILLNDNKDKPSKHEWRQANLLDEDALKRLRQRCEEDVRLTADMWNRLKPIFHNWKGT